MRRVRVGIAGMSALVFFGCLHAPVLWSPDGRWLAYTVAPRPDRPALSPGWLFEAEPAEGAGLRSPAQGPLSPRVYRIWATRAETGESVLLEESRSPLTSPCWSPDGRALAFGRIVPERDGRARFEVVVQEAPDRKRVVLTRAVNEFHARAEDLPGVAPAWSPDGRYLAVPLFQQTLSLGIVRADNGRVLKVIEDAYLPSWSPDGSKLAFVQGSEVESLFFMDHNFGPPKHLAEVGQTNQAPVWSRDSRSVAVVARGAEVRRSFSRRLDPPPPPVRLIRVHVESGKCETITTLLGEPGDRDKGYNGTSFSFDRDGDDLFHVNDVEGQLTEITWFRPRTNETAEKFHPIDPSVRIGALAVSPGGRTLALRVGAPGDLSTPALVDLASKQFTPLVPDDGSRVEWIATLVHAARELLRAHLPALDAQNRPIDRPTLLPVPGELPTQLDIAGRLRRLGRIGRTLCERPADAPAAGADLLGVLAEARLFFDYLREDYGDALAAIDALEPRLTTPAQRRRLLGVRAQVFLGQKRIEQAGRTIAFLQSGEARTGRRIEQTPAGPILVDDSATRRGWPSYLSEKASEFARASVPAPAEFPFGRQNLENANPNADFVPPPAGVPIPFAPMIQVAPPFLPLFPEFELPGAGDLNKPAQPHPRPNVPAGRNDQGR